MPTRPLSPHLSVYRMSRYTLATSIANRFTGLALSVGLLLLVYWLVAVAGGAQSYARAVRVLATPLARSAASRPSKYGPDSQSRYQWFLRQPVHWWVRDGQ